jgi:prolipoprotein diacylglyceryl transferase
VRWYGLFFAVALIFGLYFMKSVFEQEKKNIKDLDYLFIYSVIGIVVGARLFHCLFYEPKFFFNNPLSILKIWEGGLASHGGGLGLALGVLIFNHRRDDYNLLWLTDSLTIPVALGGSLIRVGNFFNSEIVGLPSKNIWAVIFKRVDKIPRHPSQLYEALLYFLIFLLVGLLYSKRSIRKKEGILTGVVLILVFSGRVLLEFFKTKQASYESVLTLNTGQLLSIPLIILGFIIIVFRKKIKI